MTEFEALIKAGLAFIPAQHRKTIELLDKKPLSCSELAKQLDTSLEYARVILGNLQKAKVACVVSWRRERKVGTATKVWGLGVKDERQPPKLTASERSARYRVKKKNTSGEVRLGIWGL
jgi:predicted ArsR family transcriptional regulator